MKIKMYKRKCIILGLVLILVGVLVSAAGFGVAGFNYNQLKNNVNDDNWYQTIHSSNDNLWYGIDLGNNIHLFSIGEAE